MIIKPHLEQDNLIKIYWHYHEEDYDMLEAGEDIAEMVEVPMTYVMVTGQ